MKNECTGNEFTQNTESSLDVMIEKAHIIKGKAQISEDAYNELMSVSDILRESNNKLKCILDTLPRESVTPETIMDDVDIKIQE